MVFKQLYTLPRPYQNNWVTMIMVLFYYIIGMIMTICPWHPLAEFLLVLSDKQAFHYQG